MGDGKKLADEHWEWFGEWVERLRYPSEFSEFVEFMERAYKGGLIHGYKHGKEVVRGTMSNKGKLPTHCHNCAMEIESDARMILEGAHWSNPLHFCNTHCAKEFLEKGY